MRVQPNELVPGCLVTKNVMGMTEHPIVPKDTVIEPIHIKVLLTFRIPYVEIAEKLVNGDAFEKIKEEDQVSNRDWSFYDHYVYSVKKTKELFQSWSYFTKINIAEIKKILVPLLEIGDKNPDLIIKLHHYADKNDYFYHHLTAVPIISSFLAKKLGYSKAERLQIAIAAYLSDVGMIKEDIELYYKDGVLTKEEYERVKKHPIVSYRLVENSPQLSKQVKLAILQHHERLDGSGYPLGLNYEKIHSYAKIIAVSDTYHAMTSERYYKSKRSPFIVLEEMLQQNFGKLDMTIVTTLANSIISFTSGTKVRLSNNKEGSIVFIDEKNLTRPMVKIDKTDEIINLLEHKNIFIDEIL